MVIDLGVYISQLMYLIQFVFNTFIMKKLFLTHVHFFLLVILISSSCSQSKYVVAPPFTDVEKISKIELGQSKEKVNEILGISPYDVLFHNGGNYVCLYNYRLLDRRLGIDNSKNNIENGPGTTLSSQEGQTSGVPFYSEWKRIYVNFENGVVKHYATDTGLEDANYIGLVNGTIKLLNSKDLDLKNFYSNPSIVIPSNNLPSNSGTSSNESLDIEKILFPLKSNGKFKSTDSPRKKSKS